MFDYFTKGNHSGRPKLFEECSLRFYDWHNVGHRVDHIAAKLLECAGVFGERRIDRRTEGVR
jgi:hypothetical protein